MLNFAYGSNLLGERLLARVPSARFVCVGKIPGWRFALNIRSTDGSAKANAVHTGRTEDVLHGAIYELDDAAKLTLDGYEDLGSAYHIAHVTADTAFGPCDVYLYVGDRTRFVEGLPPHDWYLGFILAGARQRGLPPEFIKWLDGIRSSADADSTRAATNEALIPDRLR